MITTERILSEFQRRFPDCYITIIQDYELTVVVEVNTGIISVQVGIVRYDNVGALRQFTVPRNEQDLQNIIEAAVVQIGKDVARNIENLYGGTVPHISRN